MTKLYKIRFFKDTELCKVGDIKYASLKSAKNAVSTGFAEYVIDSDKSKTTMIPAKKQDSKKIIIKTSPEELKKFHNALMKEAPDGYEPYYFPVVKGDKCPDALTIMKRAPAESICCKEKWVYKKIEVKDDPCWHCPNCKQKKGSWHAPHAKLTFDEALEYLKKGHNIGISAREKDILCITDVDHQDLIKTLPENNTLTCVSRKRAGLHFFNFTKDQKAKVNISPDYGEIRSSNQYVLSAGSYVNFTEKALDIQIEKGEIPEEMKEDILNDPKLGLYTVLKETPPAWIKYEDYPQYFLDENKEPETEEPKEETKEKDYSNSKYNPLFELKISDVIGEHKRNTRFPHPLHDSDTGANFSVNSDDKTCSCWRHLRSFNAVHLLAIKSGKFECQDVGKKHKGAKREITKELLEAAYAQAVEMELIVPNPKVKLPGANRPIQTFVKEASYFFEGDNEIFYKANENKLVEIKSHFNIIQNKSVTGFFEIDSKRFFSKFEEKIQTFIVKFNDTTQVFDEIDKSPSEQVLKLMMENDLFINKLNIVNRFFSFPILFIQDKKLKASKIGYDERLQAYFTKDCPEIKMIPVNEAKEIINDILSEFCFKEDVDKTMAISYILTPACRGLYERIVCRTPLYMIMGNRERCGKDYLASIVSILYLGESKENSAISSGDGSQNNEELRKKFTASLMAGERFYHSSNNKGCINNAILEGFLTVENWQDRILGRNETISLPNETDVSLSGNIGLTFSPDLWHRSRPINLFFAEEDPNKRTFTRPDLRGYVLKNRGNILSAIFTLIKDWYVSGCPNDASPFTSFPEWAKIIGGIMVHHELGDPCIQIASEVIGGDTETRDFKLLFELMYKNIEEITKKKETKKNDIIFTLAEIREFIAKKQDEEGFFSYYDFLDRKCQVKFGKKFPKYVGRIFSDIELKIAGDSNLSYRKTYTFAKVANIAKVSIPIETFEDKKVIVREIPQQPQQPQQNIQDFILISINKDKKDIESLKKAITEKYPYDSVDPDSIIKIMLKNGDIFEKEPGILEVNK